MAKYRVAIIGAGHRAGAHDAKFRGKGRRRLSHADAYSHIEQCELVGAADPNAENLARLCGSYDIPRRFADYRDLLCELKPDIISICTTARPRAEIIIAAAELGVRGIYAEKALCSSMEEADRIRDACRKAGVAFNYGTNRRFDINFGAVRSAVMDGIIGDPEGAGFFGADLIMHGGSHVFDTLMFLLGDPAVEYVQGSLAAYEERGEKWLPEGRKVFNRPIYNSAENRFEPDPTLGVNDFTSDPGMDWAVVQFEGGVQGHVVRSPAMYEFAVYGSQGHVYCSEGTPAYTVRRRPTRFSHEFAAEPLALPEFQDSTECIIHDLIRGLETGQPTTGNIDVAHLGTEICLAVAESHIHEGGRVPLPLANRTLCVPNH